jgi:ClpP class serine protease
MLEHRLELYKKLERIRERPLIVYVTSARGGAPGQIAGDSVTELLLQLDGLPRSSSSVDLLVVSNGGDPTVAWRFVSLIRERVKHLSVLVPQAAFSAATLIALGANEIVMHPPMRIS